MGRSAKAAGLHASCAKWLKQRDIAILGSDAASDLSPSGIPGVTHPIHQLVLIAMGVNIFDNCDLEAVSEACCPSQSLGVPIDGRSYSGKRRNWFPAESNRNF